MKLFTTQEFADLVGKNKATIIRWDKSNKLIPYKMVGDNRYYSAEQVRQILGDEFDELEVMEKRELIELVRKMRECNGQ